MQNVLKQKVTVQPGGIVHIESPELVPGSIADVIIIPEPSAAQAAALASLIGTATGGFCHATSGRCVHSSRTTYMARIETLTGRLPEHQYLRLRAGRLPGLSTNLNLTL